MSRIDSLVRFVKPGWRPQSAIPPLDGPLTPNDDLESATVLHQLDGAVDACRRGDGALVASAGDRIVVLSSEGVRHLATLPGPAMTCAPYGANGLLVGVTGRGVWSVDVHGQVHELLGSVDGVPVSCPTGITESRDGRLMITDGSAEHAEDWARDLYSKGASGRLIVLDPRSGHATVVDRGLRYPAGVCTTGDGTGLLVSEAWSHTVWKYNLEAKSTIGRTVLVANLPAYPGRLQRRAEGGYVLSGFALRTQLVEFVLRQDSYRREMMRTIPPELWVRPALTTINSGLEPLQAGQMKKLGITKPWAPPRSYGLVMQLAEDGSVERSWHSRTGGRHHGVTGVVPSGDGFLAVAAGSGSIVEVGQS